MRPSASGIILIACTLLAGDQQFADWRRLRRRLWETKIGSLSLAHWINDGLMAIFFLYIGLELERELYVGELSSFRSALLPMIAAVGGMVAPAAIHYLFNAGTPTQAGFGIPMATDIAFAIGVLAILGSRIPAALKVFVVAFAVMDDLGAIIVIAAFYTADLSHRLSRRRALPSGACSRAQSPFPHHGDLALPDRRRRHVMVFMLKSGVCNARRRSAGLRHPVLAQGRRPEIAVAPARGILNKPVAFVILPIFALGQHLHRHRRRLVCRTRQRQ